MFINKGPDGRNNICGVRIAQLRSEKGISQRMLADQLQLLGLDKKDSCSYTNSGTATISDTELQELLHTKGLPFPNGIVGQRIKILSNLEMQKEQAQADILQQLSSSGEELNIDG